MQIEFIFIFSFQNDVSDEFRNLLIDASLFPNGCERIKMITI